jgi:hypothetical protein
VRSGGFTMSRLPLSPSPPRLAAALKNQQVRLRELQVAAQQPDGGIFSLAALLSTGSRTLTESYRAAPFQGWSVMRKPDAEGSVKTLNPKTPTGRARTSPLRRARFATPLGQESASGFGPGFGTVSSSDQTGIVRPERFNQDHPLPSCGA